MKVEGRVKFGGLDTRMAMTSTFAEKCCLFLLTALVATYVCFLSSTLTVGGDVRHPQAEPTSERILKIHARSLLNVNDVPQPRPIIPRAKVEDRDCYLRDKLHGSQLPDVHSVFADPVSGQVVFVGLKYLRQPWHQVPFRCEFPNGEFSAVHAVDDRRSFGHFPQYVVVLTCPMPDRYRTRDAFHVHLKRLPGNQTYWNIKVCATPRVQLYFLAMCTMVRSVDSFIPPWLEYHKYLGVQHVYIYDNAIKSKSTLETSLRGYIKSGFVTIVPWAHSISRNKTYLEVQIAHENDCIWRHKHDAHWMIKIDVDEYVQPMDAAKPRITDYLNDSMYDNVAGLRIQNWFFGHPPNISPQGKSIIERNRWRSKTPTLQNTGHDKNILRPINVHYFKIHNVKLGGDVVSADPYTELRLVHYRADNPRIRRFPLPKFSQKDESMLRIREAFVKQVLENKRLRLEKAQQAKAAN